jgi:uncharacterized cupredoxin-like copper-binding protein
MNGSRRVLVAAGLGVALAAGACGAKSPASPTAASPTGGSGNSVTATLSDFTIALGSSSGTAGSVTFTVANNGPSEHEFVVLQTDLAADQLPITTENGAQIASEEASDITNIGEAEDIQSGSTTTLTLQLPAGTYVMICNLPAHYGLGMRAAFTVGG